MLMPVLRYMTGAQNRTPADGFPGYILPVQRDGAVWQRLQAGQSIDQLCLSIAVDTRHTDNLPAFYLKTHIVDRIFFMSIGCYWHMAHIQHHPAGLRRFFIHFKAHIPPHHHGRELFRCSILNVHRSHVFPLPQDRASVGHFHNFI